MRNQVSFLEALKLIEDKKEQYEIILDHDVVRISPKDEENDLEDYYYNTTPTDILWDLLVAQGFDVTEG